MTHPSTARIQLYTKVSTHNAERLSERIRNDIKFYPCVELSFFSELLLLFCLSVPSFLYGALTSTAESLVGVTGFGRAFTFILGSSAAATRARELYNRGASPTETLIGSLSSGINEALWEYVSLDKLLKANPHTTKQYFKTILTQAGIEGSEELATDISNAFADGYILGDKSDFNYEIQRLLSENPDMAYDEAREIAGKHMVEQSLESFLAGAISGGFSAAGYTAPAIVQGIRTDRASGRNVASQEGATDLFVQQGLQQDEGTEARKRAEAIKNRASKGKTISPGKLGALGWTLTQEEASLSQEKRSELREYMNRASNKSNIVKALTEKGMAEEKAQEVAPAVVKAINNEETNRAERRAVEFNEAAKEYVQEVQEKLWFSVTVQCLSLF